MSDTLWIIISIWAVGFFIDRRLKGIMMMLERFHEEAREEHDDDER